MPICIGRIYRDEFVQICQKLLEKKLQTLIETAILSGGRNARLEREWLGEVRSVFLPSPTHEILLIDTLNGKEFLNTTTGYISGQQPCSDPRSFSSMAFTAARIVLPCLCFCLEQLIQKQGPEELRQSCESVIDATSVFTILEGEHGPTRSSDLDAILSLAHSVSLQDKKMGARPTWPPYEDLKLVQEEFYGLLRPIQGFLSSLQSPTLKDLETFKITSPRPLSILSFQDWRRLQMPRRANDIEYQAAVCRNLRKQIQDCRTSRNRNSMTKETNAKERNALAEVRELQLRENVSVEYPNVRLHVLSAEGLKKTGTFRGRFIPILCLGKLGANLSASRQTSKYVKETCGITTSERGSRMRSTLIFIHVFGSSRVIDIRSDINLQCRRWPLNLDPARAWDITRLPIEEAIADKC